MDNEKLVAVVVLAASEALRQHRKQIQRILCFVLQI